MNEMIELARYLRSSEEHADVKRPIPSKSRSPALMGCLAVEVMLVLIFGTLLIVTVASLPPYLNLGMSKVMHVMSRVAAFAGILAFFHFSFRACLAGIDRSRDWAQRMGWGALILTVVALTLAACIILLFFSFPNY
jgi:hypothetical protein